MLRKSVVTLVLVILLGCVSACSSPSSPAPSSTPSPTPSSSPNPTATYNQYQLAYRLLAAYPGFFWCDPDFYPVAREGQEQKNALEQFPAIKANPAELSAILASLGWPTKADFSDAEKLDIYREHKKLTRALQMTVSGASYLFSLRVGEGQLIEGSISASGEIKESKRERSFNTCPICLSAGTLIDTPLGLVPVDKLQSGMPVWTMDSSGQRTTGQVLFTSSTLVPVNFPMIRIVLKDGRTLTASHGHPTATSKAWGSYQTGEVLDGAEVASVTEVPYDGCSTFDLLPSGESGLYWANGILLKSTLRR
jgi:hypothetical protein